MLSLSVSVAMDKYLTFGLVFLIRKSRDYRLSAIGSKMGVSGLVQFS